MGNKRKHEDEEDRLLKKIRKLEKKLHRQRCRVSSDDNDPEGQVLPTVTPSNSPAVSPINCNGPALDMPSLSPIPRANTPTEPTLNVVREDVEPGPSSVPNTLEQETETELENEILQILGEAPQPETALGKNIHKDIASRWQDILQKGLSKEVKEPIMKKYLIPSNCNLLVAPLLNPEAKTAVPEIIAKRDATLLQKQSQIGVALAALSQLSEMILRNETSKQVLFQPLSDACRLLCDSHSIETKTRRNILMSSMNTTLRDTLANAARDKYLFGEDLSEKLKIAKTVQKTGESLVNNNPIPTSSKNPNQRSNPKKNLNFRGQIQRKPPIKTNEQSRGRPTARQVRAPAYPRHTTAPPSKMSPSKRNYRR